MPVFLNSAEPGFEGALRALLVARREAATDVDAVVATIIADVQRRGDAALLELTARFDRVQLTPQTLAFSPAEMDGECAKVGAGDRAALELAAARIRAYHQRQVPEDANWTDGDGVRLGWRESHRYRLIDRRAVALQGGACGSNRGSHRD